MHATCGDRPGFTDKYDVCVSFNCELVLACTTFDRFLICLPFPTFLCRLFWLVTSTKYAIVVANMLIVCVVRRNKFTIAVVIMGTVFLPFEL